jgi:hypothetical protein
MMKYCQNCFIFAGQRIEDGIQAHHIAQDDSRCGGANECL